MGEAVADRVRMLTYREDLRPAWDRIESFPREGPDIRFETSG